MLVYVARLRLPPAVVIAEQVSVAAWLWFVDRAASVAGAGQNVFPAGFAGRRPGAVVLPGRAAVVSSLPGPQSLDSLP